MKDVFDLVDRLGPFKVLHISLPQAGLKAVVAVDNLACGPAIGGVRIAADADAEEACRLARAMTFKNAVAGLAHGGGKAVIVADPKMMSLRQREQVIRAFATAIANLTEYIPGPDMGTDELAMAWVHDEIGRAVGLPRELGGIPLDELGATGFGLAIALEVAAKAIALELRGARVAVQGFGSVGRHAARFLAQRGCRLVACSDTRGSVSSPDGLDVGALTALKQAGQSVIESTDGKKADPEAVLDVPCDIWIPAARPDVLNKDNASRIKARIVAEGANIPCTLEAELILEKLGVLVLPDFLVNSGGVICAATEYHGGTEAAAFDAIAEKLRRNTAAVIDEAGRRGISTREASIALATARLQRAERTRRWHGDNP